MKISCKVSVWVISQPAPDKSYTVVGLNYATQPKSPIETVINKEMEKNTPKLLVCLSPGKVAKTETKLHHPSHQTCIQLLMKHTAYWYWSGTHYITNPLGGMSGEWIAKNIYSHRLKLQLEKQGHKEIFLYIPVHDCSQP